MDSEQLAHLVSWSATAVTFLGTAALTHRARSGWAFKVAGALLWLWFALLTHYPALVVEALLGLAVNGYGLVQWYREDPHADSG